MEGSLDPSKVKGKLVICQLLTRGAESVIKRLGGIGAIVESIVLLDVAQIYSAPGTMVNKTVGLAIHDYIHSNK